MERCCTKGRPLAQRAGRSVIRTDRGASGRSGSLEQPGIDACLVELVLAVLQLAYELATFERLEAYAARFILELVTHTRRQAL